MLLLALWLQSRGWQPKQVTHAVIRNMAVPGSIANVANRFENTIFESRSICRWMHFAGGVAQQVMRYLEGHPARLRPDDSWWIWGSPGRTFIVI